MGTFAHLEYPDKETVRSYRIPDAPRFCEWGMMPGPISHYMAVSLVRCSGHYHLAHDASTKGKLAHIFQTVVTCVLKGSGGKKQVVAALLRFDICPSGTVAAGAKLTQGALPLRHRPRPALGAPQSTPSLHARITQSPGRRTRSRSWRKRR